MFTPVFTKSSVGYSRETRGYSDGDYFDRMTEDQDNGCLAWIGPSDAQGYGKAYRPGNKEYSAHRWSYLIHNGDLVPGQVVRHTCDNRICVNPKHLVSGTRGDNNRDTASRSIRKDGVTNVQAQVIRARALSDETQCSLAKEYGISESALSSIVRGVTRIYGKIGF